MRGCRCGASLRCVALSLTRAGANCSQIMNIRRVVVKPSATPYARGTFIVSLVLLNLVLSHAAHVLDAYRLVQFDRGTQTLGSRRTLMNHLGTTVKAPIQTGPAAPIAADDGSDDSNAPTPAAAPAAANVKPDLARKVVVLHIRQLTSQLMSELIDRRGAVGVVIVLPSEAELNAGSIPAADIARWRAFEQFLLSREFQAPIYFAFEDQDLAAIVDRVTADPDGSADRYQFVVSSSEGTLVPTPSIPNFHGWHHSAPSSTGDADSVPTIAIVADYDSFAAAPSLAFGVDQNGSGTIAVLELIRVFGRLYSEFRTHGQYNLLFLLTGAGRLNSAGIKHWLKNVDARVLESIEFALCIDAIGSGEELYLHVSKNATKSAAAAAVYDAFSTGAAAAGIPFEVVHRKINISHPITQWAHEQFARKHVLSGTLSSHRVAAPLWSRASIFDRRNSVSTPILIRNIKLIAEVIAKRIYPIAAAAANAASKREIISQTQGVSESFVSGWLNFLSSQSRVAGHIQRTNEAAVEIEKVFNAHTADPKKSAFPLEAGFKFYTSTTEQLSIYNVKPLSFDLYLFVAVCLWCGVLHIAVRAFSDWEALIVSFPFLAAFGPAAADADAPAPAPVATKKAPKPAAAPAPTRAAAAPAPAAAAPKKRAALPAPTPAVSVPVAAVVTPTPAPVSAAAAAPAAAPSVAFAEPIATSAGTEKPKPKVTRKD